MKLLHCPLNGVRPIEEFVYGGELRRVPTPDACSDARWSDHVFSHSLPSVKREWWCHVPSGYWFIAERNTANDVVIATYAAEPLRERSR